eukprot:m.170026 g.170026  ORF g.170026 m.170026 type:complete len:822 (+) comp13184_c0_seq1:107-2572(+)
MPGRAPQRGLLPVLLAVGGVVISPRFALAHLTDICISVAPDVTDQCESATLWLMSYHHSTQGTAQGHAAVSVGTNPHPNSPFDFLSMCDGMNIARPDSVGDLASDMGSRWRDFCPSDIHSQLSEGLELTCFATIDPTTRVITQHPPTTRPGCGGCCGSRGIDEAGFVRITNVTARQDVSVSVFGVDHTLLATGADTHACSIPTDNGAFELDQGAFGSSPSMSGLRFTIPAGTLRIPGCGAPCGAYSPAASLNVFSHSCTNTSVGAGTLCNVQCAPGFVAAGTPVSCVGGTEGNPGSYDGMTMCTDEVTSSSSCSNGVCPDIGVVVGDTVTQITGPGCGQLTVNGTECGFSCDRTDSVFSTGNVVALNGGWTTLNGAACLPCEGSTCDATPDLSVDATNVVRVDDEAAATSAVCVPGFNFDPENDRVILITDPNMECGSVEAGAAGGAFLDCNTATTACGAASQNMLACGGFPDNDLPTEGRVCVCDADVQNGCSDSHRKYTTTGPVIDTSTFVFQGSQAPTPAPTSSPTPLCARIFQTLTLSESSNCDAGSGAGGDDDAVDCYATSRTSHESTTLARDEVEDALVAWWGETGPFSDDLWIEDALLSITTSGAWASDEATVRTLSVDIEFRPNTPISTGEVGNALAAVDATSFSLQYCGCQSTFTVVDTAVGFREVNSGDTQAASAEECPGTFDATQDRTGDGGGTSGKKGKKGKKSKKDMGKTKNKSKKSKSGKKGKNQGSRLLSATPVAATGSAVVVGLALAGVAVLSAFLSVSVRRRSQDFSDEPDEYSSLIPSYDPGPSVLGYGSGGYGSGGVQPIHN